MANTSIEWTEKTWNPVTGCNKVSQGCKNCYAETIAERFWGKRKFTDIVLHDDRIIQPIHWKKPAMIFVNSMSDLFHEKVTNEFIREVFFMMALTPQHTYQVLTKRPERLIEFYTYLNDYIGEYDCGSEINPWYRNGMKNLWLGVSVEDQKTADERIPILLQVPAAVRWISAEPLLDKIDLGKWASPCGYYCGHEPEGLENWLAENPQADGYDYYLMNHHPEKSKLDWVVVGGESGAKARRCEIEWIEKIVTDCKSANVPVFVKQLGKRCFIGSVRLVFNNGKGGDINEFPEELKVREYPEKFIQPKFREVR